MSAPVNYQQLHGALKLLVGNQGEVEPSDYEYLKILVDTPVGEWSPSIAMSAWKTCDRYRNNLISFGVHIDLIAKPNPIDLRRHVGSKGGFECTINGSIVKLQSSGFPGKPAVAAVKSITGAAFVDDQKRRRKFWTAPLASAAEILRVEAAGHIRCAKKVHEILLHQVELSSAAATMSRDVDSELSITGLGGDLYPYQRAGVKYLHTFKRAMLADDLGLGKTVQAIAGLKSLDAFPALCIVPANVKVNWVRKIREWLPGINRVEMLRGRKPLPLTPGTGVAVINYDILYQWRSTLTAYDFKAIVFDEIHFLKDGKSQRAKAAMSVVRALDPKVRIGLSGTPVINSPKDLVMQLKLLGRLEDMGGYKHFTKSYCVKGKYGGYARHGKNLKKMNARLRSSGIYIRRLKSEVLHDLPDKTRDRIEIGVKNRGQYDSMQVKVAQRIKAARIEKARAKQEGRDPEGWAKAAGVMAITDLRKEVARQKIDACVDWIRELLKTTDQGVVVVGVHREIVTDRIAEEFGCPKIVGGMTPEQKQAAVDLFVSEKDVRVLVMNMKAGGTGTDGLQHAASNIVFIESGWSPAENEQTEDRIYRIGTKDAVNAWYLEAANTIDPWLSDLIAQKRITASEATEGDEAEERSVQADLINMLEEKYAA